MLLMPKATKVRMSHVRGAMPQQIHHLLVSSIHFLFIFRKTFLLCLFLQCLIEGLKLGLGCKKTIQCTGKVFLIGIRKRDFFLQRKFLHLNQWTNGLLQIA